MVTTRRAGGTRSYVLVTPTAGNALSSLLRQGRQKQGTRCRGCTERELVHQGEEVAVGLRTDVDEHDRRSALRGHDAHQSLAQGEVENAVSDGVRRDARIARGHARGSRGGARVPPRWRSGARA